MTIGLSVGVFDWYCMAEQEKLNWTALSDNYILRKGDIDDSFCISDI